MKLEQVERLLNKRSVCDTLKQHGFPLREQMTEYLLSTYPQTDLSDETICSDLNLKFNGVQQTVVIQQPTQQQTYQQVSGQPYAQTSTTYTQQPPLVQQVMTSSGSKEEFRNLALKFGFILALVAIGAIILRVATPVDNAPVLGEIANTLIDVGLVLLTGKTVTNFVKSK